MVAGWLAGWLLVRWLQLGCFLVTSRSQPACLDFPCLVACITCHVMHPADLAQPVAASRTPSFGFLIHDSSRRWLSMARNDHRLPTSSRAVHYWTEQYNGLVCLLRHRRGWARLDLSPVQRSSCIRWHPPCLGPAASSYRPCSQHLGICGWPMTNLSAHCRLASLVDPPTRLAASRRG